jgi:hypothetical protein
LRKRPEEELSLFLGKGTDAAVINEAPRYQDVEGGEVVK